MRQVRLLVRAGLLLAVLLSTGLSVATAITIYTPPPQESAANAQVRTGVYGLRLRDQPGTQGAIITHLNGGIPLLVQGRSEDGRWFQVMIPDGMVGWLSVAYVDVSSPVEDSPVTAPQPVLDAGGNGRVGAISSLRLRAGPGTEYGTLGYLPGGTSLQVVGQTDDGIWLQVQTANGRSGWVAARYVEMTGDQGALEIPIEETAPPAVPIDFNGVVTGITGTSHQLYARGRELGNHANVFAKVGDSLTVSQYVLYPIGWGGYTLGSYEYLRPVIDHFAAGRIGGVNPFSRVSLSAGIGWSSAHVVDASLANRALCQAGEAPLRCEYRIARPSVAIIMLGTNDMTFMNARGYSVYLRNIVGTSVDMGVIPVLCTIPNRAYFDGAVIEFNRIIIGVAREFDVPLCDYYAVMQRAPNGGLSSDGVHPSEPPGRYSAGADFRVENLQYGYVLRNLTVLHALDAVWRQVMGGG